MVTVAVGSPSPGDVLGRLYFLVYLYFCISEFFYFSPLFMLEVGFLSFGIFVAFMFLFTGGENCREDTF